jgi:secreted PhoX family phosphatase
MVWGLTADPDNGSTVTDVLIEARRAATSWRHPDGPPEDVGPNPVTGRSTHLTNNSNRTKDRWMPQPAPAKRRPCHRVGAAGALTRHAALKFRWNILLLAGNPEARGGAGLPRN